MRKKWVNFVNFIRHDDFRSPGMDLFEPVREQMALHKRFGVPATWLMQVDAILLGPYAEFFSQEKPADHELGLWLEINRAHCDKAGVKYNGRQGVNWDYHANAALSIGYLPEDRLKLADTAMEVFHDAFGIYPRTVAAWYIDAVTLAHLHRKYGIKASANCRDQWGTDGYSLWGGFWGGAYYPSIGNAFVPGNSAQEQIPVPVFRLLGSCPIEQYDCDVGANGQRVCTLEPVWEHGRDPRWIKSFVDNMLERVPFEYSFVQTGQENSFGWDAIRDGYGLQIEFFHDLRRQGKVICETMEKAGAWYGKTFAQTAPLAVVAKSDSALRERRSIWYNSRLYRAGVLVDNGQLRIRDLHLYRSNYPDRYQDKPCLDKAMIVDSLPLVEGFLWRKEQSDASARIQLRRDGAWTEIDWSSMKIVPNEATHTLTLESRAGLAIIFREDEMAIDSANEAIRIVMPKKDAEWPSIHGQEIESVHNGFAYKIHAEGIIASQDDRNSLYVEFSGKRSGKLKFCVQGGIRQQEEPMTT